MNRPWTFGQKMAAGYAVIVALAILVGLISVIALRTVVASKERVIAVYAENLTDASRLEAAASRRVVAVRGYMLDKAGTDLDETRVYLESFQAVLARLRSRTTDPEGTEVLNRLERAAAEHRAASERMLGLRNSDVPPATLVRVFDEEVRPRFAALLKQIEDFGAIQQRRRDASSQASTEAANLAIQQVGAAVVLVAASAIVAAVVLTRALGQRIGAAVGHVQSSSAELQAAASQQASGARQQASAMTEIATTISELVATSRQIAESAQRVAQVAQQTADAARSGDGTLEKGRESITGIDRQVGQVVQHILELGRKSQEIGAVADIVAELAEQTNILAINATIEASGAGEAGKRFAVVAEEIRKLADRVASSTKQIRGQIDDVRAAVNATVMVTEGSAKAVAEGTRQFGEVAQAFRQIATLVETTTDAVREIELSTKQQATAAEQVRIAMTDVAQTTREVESSSGQTLQTASELASLSSELRRLV